MSFQPLKRNKNHFLLCFLSTTSSPDPLLVQSTECVSETASIRCQRLTAIPSLCWKTTGMCSLASWVTEKCFCKIALWQNGTGPHSREMLTFSNSSWQDHWGGRRTLLDCWQVRGKQKALCQLLCGHEEASHLEKREEDRSATGLTWRLQSPR